MGVVGDLVVNLVASTAGFSAGLGAAQVGVKKFSSGLGSMLGGIGGMVAGIGAPIAAALGLHEAIAGFRESELASKKLDAVLAATGGAAGVSGDEIRALAGDLQRTTNFEDDATIAAAGVLATFKEIKGDTFKGAIVAAQDLSAVMGQDLQSSIVQVGKALNNPIKGVTALQRVGVSFSEEQKKQIAQLQKSGDLAGAQAIIMAELQSEFGGAAKAMADPMTILWNVIGDIGESIGSLIVPPLNEVLTILMEAIGPSASTLGESFSEWGKIIASEIIPFVEQFAAVAEAAFGFVGAVFSSVFGGISENAGSVFATIKEFVLDWLIFSEFAWSNFGEVAKLAGATAVLAIIQLGGTVAHFFTDVIPTYLTWLSTSWRDTFFSLGDYVMTVFINMGQNIRNVMTEIWDFIASGGKDSLSLSWTPLTDGFANTMREIPNIPERMKGPIEKAWQSTVDGLGKSVGDGFKEFREQRLAELSDVGNEIIQPDFKTPDPTENQSLGNNLTQQKGKTGALEAGSKEALSAIFGAMRTKGQDKALKVAEDQLGIQERMAESLEEIADRDDMELVGAEF